MQKTAKVVKVKKIDELIARKNVIQQTLWLIAVIIAFSWLLTPQPQNFPEIAKWLARGAILIALIVEITSEYRNWGFVCIWGAHLLLVIRDNFFM